MSTAVRTFALTCLAMVAFAGNSLLCRAALKGTDIDAASFTSLRLLSGALVLGLIVSFRRDGREGQGSWLSGLWLFTYAAAFSFAYLSLSAATGALLLFAAVQVTMIGHGFWVGERLQRAQWLGVLLAIAGLVGLLLPGVSAPPLLGASLMILAGLAWGLYSLRGRRAGDATMVTAGNFRYAVLFGLILSALAAPQFSIDPAGAGYALASGALASGLGYAIWYTALPHLKATSAATVQLSVPVIAAVGGVLLLGESLSLRLVLASLAVLGGIALVIVEKR